jgi:hypothetical protein
MPRDDAESLALTHVQRATLWCSVRRKCVPSLRFCGINNWAMHCTYTVTVDLDAALLVRGGGISKSQRTNVARDLLQWSLEAGLLVQHDTGNYVSKSVYMFDNPRCYFKKCKICIHLDRAKD